MVADGPVTREVELVNPQGLHARPASLLVRKANEFDASVKLWIDGDQADCKSIMEVMMLASPQGTRVTIEADGPDSGTVVEALAKLFADGFGEAYE